MYIIQAHDIVNIKHILFMTTYDYLKWLILDAHFRSVAALEQAEGDKIRVVKNAEAEAESKYLAGVGVARQRQAIVNGLRDSIVGFTDGVKVGVTVLMFILMVLLS